MRATVVIAALLAGLLAAHAQPQPSKGKGAPATGQPAAGKRRYAADYDPAGTPKAVVDKLNAEVQRITALPDVREKLTTRGAEPVAMSPADFSGWLKTEIPAMAKIVKDEKITIE